MKNKTAKVITTKAEMGTILRLSGLMCACFTAYVLVFSFDVSHAAQGARLNSSSDAARTTRVPAQHGVLLAGST
jgi:hypothetical protein